MSITFGNFSPEPPRSIASRQKARQAARQRRQAPCRQPPAGRYGRKAGAGLSLACVRAEVPSRIEIVTDDPEAAALVTIEVAAVTEDTEVHAELPVRLNGTHDLYFRFTESGVSLLEWQFE